jgi:flagellar basal-body rod modification protein FlgD
MPVDAITPSVSSTTSATATQPSQTTTDDERMGIGRDAFMQLLLAQMRYQDPLNPMEDRDFIAQLAQLNTLEQLEQLNESLSDFMGQQNLLRGAELIGKTIRGTTAQGEYVEGIVVAVRTDGAEVVVSLGDKDVPLKDVSLVTQ